MIFRLDVCGILCVLMTFGAIGYADYAVMYVMVLPTFVESIWGTFHIFIFNSLLFLGIIAHFKAMTTDPGIVPLQRNKKTDEKILKMEQEKSGHFYEDDYSDSEEDEFVEKTQLEDGTLQCIKDNWTVCMRCRSFRPPRAHHCRVCQRCVSLYDHHCPWVNNCIGEFNQKYFLQFLLFIGLSAIYAIFVVILSWSFHDDGGLTGKNGPFGESAHHLKVLHTIFLTIESSMFGMFVLAVSCDQLQAIFKDETPIERLQRRGYSGRRTSKSKYSQMAKVCGQAKWYKWFIPCTRTYFRKEIIHFPQESRTVV